MPPQTLSSQPNEPRWEDIDARKFLNYVSGELDALRDATARAKLAPEMTSNTINLPDYVLEQVRIVQTLSQPQYLRIFDSITLAVDALSQGDLKWLKKSPQETFGRFFKKGIVPSMAPSPEFSDVFFARTSCFTIVPSVL